MKKTINILITGLALLFLSATCEGPKTADSKKTDSKEVTPDNSPAYKVSGKVSIVEPYCGGAAPPRDKRINEPSPYANQEILIKLGSQNDGKLEDIIRIQTNEMGNFETMLPKGTYCLIAADKGQPFEDFYKIWNKDYDQFYTKKGKECYQTWWKTCDLSFEVTEAGATIEHTFRKRCFVGADPCLEYDGPMPP